MQMTHSRQKYQSLVLSLLLHVLLLLFFFMLKMSQRLPFSDEAAEKRTTPAQVSFQTRPTPPIPRAQPLPIQPSTVQSAPKAQPVAPQAHAPQPQIAPLDTAAPTAQEPAQDQPLSQSATEQEAGAGENAKDEQESSTTGFPEGYTSDVSPKTTTASGPYDGRNAGAHPQGRRGKSSISGSAFMNAFRQSIRAEREEIANTTSGRSHVQQRLEDWAQAHYIEKINRAIRQATLFPTKYIHLDDDIEKTVILEIPIEKNGTLGKMADVITGIEAADEFIKSVLRAADLPPLPKRFAKERFIYKVSFGVSLKKGTNYGRIHWG